MTKNTLTTIGRIFKKSPVETVFAAFLAFAMLVTIIPSVDSADSSAPGGFLEETVSLQIQAMQNATEPFGVFPVAANRPPVKQMTVPVTAYNSVPGQTDATPCIGAAGTDICKYLAAGSNTCAANFVPLGTVLKVEGLGTCVVRDRMNARYYYRVDWYMGMDVAAARKFGVQHKSVGIYAS